MTIRLYIAAARSPPRSDPQKSQDFLLWRCLHNRKNQLFAGDEGGAETWAILASLITTAKLNDVDPFTWLNDALEKIVSGSVKANDLDQVLVWNWKAAREAERLAA